MCRLVVSSWAGVCCRNEDWLDAVTSWFSQRFRPDEAVPPGDEEEKPEGEEQQQVCCGDYICHFGEFHYCP